MTSALSLDILDFYPTNKNCMLQWPCNCMFAAVARKVDSLIAAVGANVGSGFYLITVRMLPF